MVGFPSSGIFLIALLLAFPLLWGGAGFFDLAPLFSTVNLTLLALLLLLSRPHRIRELVRQPRSRQLIPLLMLPAGIVILLHFLNRPGNHDLFWQGAFYLVIPLTGAVFQHQFRRPLLFFLLFLGLANLLFTVNLLFHGRLPTGLTGNWNWSITLFLLSIAAAGHLWSEKLPKNLPFRHLDLILPAAFLLFYGLFFPAYFSRAGAAGFLLAASVILLWRTKRWTPVVFRLSLMLPAGLLLLLTLLPLAGNLKSRFSAHDVRADLNLAALTLIADAPWLGTGPGRFESAVAPFVPESYYLGEFAAERHPHPHNELLYYWATFGFGGLLLAAAVMLMFVLAAEKYFTAGKRFRRVNRPMEFYCFAFLLLWAHGTLDTLLANWPCDTLFLLISGILWGFAAVPATEPGDGTAAPPTRRTAGRRILQIAIAVLLAYSLFTTLVSGLYLRAARLAAARGDKILYGDLLEKSRAVKPTPENIYRGAMVELFDRRRPEKAAGLLLSLEPETGLVNYLHNHGLLARALAAGGKPEESLRQFELEQLNFPLGAVNLYFHEQVLRHLNREAEAAEIHARLLHNLATKNLTLDAIPMLIRNPQFDVNFHHIPREP